MYLPIYTKPLWWYNYPDFINKNIIVDKILTCYNQDGGFGNYPSNPSYLETIFYASVSLSLLNEIDKINESTLNYILKSQMENGGFGEFNGNSSNLFNTFYAVTILKILDKITPEIRYKVIGYLSRNIIHEDEICESRIGIANTTSTFWVNAIVKSISYFDNHLDSIMVDFCRSCYDESTGLFSAVPNGIPTIQNTYECLAILKECSKLNLINTELTYNSILERKNEHLFFDDLLSYHTYSSCMWAILSLNIINKLNQLEQSDVLALAMSKIKDGNSLFEIFCSVNIIANISYDKGKILTDHTQVVCENGETKSLEKINEAIRNMSKNGIDYIDFDYNNLLSISTATEIIPHDVFVQILLDTNYNRLFEIEYNTERAKVIGLLVPISRVTSECISLRMISSTKIKLLGVFDSDNNLNYNFQEKTIISDYCKNNNLYKYTQLVGKDATFYNVNNSVQQGCHILYYSGHSENGNLHFYDGLQNINDFFDLLVQNHCTIAILNCCNTYQYIEEYFERNKYLNESMNIICTINDVSDKQAKSFITILFKYLEIGYPISEALRLARLEIYNMLNGCGNTWWSYILFGNPFTVL